VFSFELPGASHAGRGVLESHGGDDAAGGDVLVVDDNRDAADSLAEILRLLGYRVRTAYGGAAALAAVSEEPPAALLLDIGMPDMDGPTVLRAVRELPGGMAVFACAVSGFGAEDEKAGRADFRGFDARLQKPVDLPELQSLLQKSHAVALPGTG
jgi:CheY-like chemotaxis protein